MRKYAFLALVISAVLMSAQSKKPAAAQSRPAVKPTPKPTPAAIRSKVTGPPKTTPSGVQYWDVKIGNGAEAARGKTVSILYVGWLENGKEFKAEDDPDIPMQLTIGDGKQIIGWDEGITGMKVGGKRQLRIPPAAGYGEKGAPPLVPPNATMIMDVRLLAVK